MEVFQNPTPSRLINPARGDRSDKDSPETSTSFSVVNPDRGDRSESGLSRSLSYSRYAENRSPFQVLLSPDFLPKGLINVAISSAVIETTVVSPLPSASAIAGAEV